MTNQTMLTWHTNAGELSSSIDTSPQVLARLAVALINILFTSWSGVTLQRFINNHHDIALIK